MAAAPVPKFGSPNNRMSSSGWGRRSSTNPNTTASTAPAMRQPNTRGSLQPYAGACRMPNTNTATAAPMVTAPGTSRRGESASRDSAMVSVSKKTSNPPIASVQKIACQSKNSISSPVPTNPNRPAVPATPAQMPTALARASGGYATVNSDKVAGITNA